MTNIKERVLAFLNYQGITKSKFFEVTGIAASNFKGQGLKSEIGGDSIVKILTHYPHLSAEWLLTGKGSMVKKGDLSNDPLGDLLNKKVHFSEENVPMELREPEEGYKRQIVAEVLVDEQAESLIIRLPGLFKRISRLEGKVSELAEVIKKMKGETPD